jgi:surfactin synthase thioesterase subunit
VTDIVFFPGAGSFGGEFQPLTGPDAWLIKYPGRTGRGFGTPAASFDDLVRETTAQVAARSAEPPVLFGHSFGAYVAWATAHRLPAVAALILFGAPAPARLRIPEAATRDPAATAAFLTAADPAMLAGAPSDDWREIVVETAMRDLHLLVQLDFAAWPGLSCPIVVVRGEDDPLTPAGDATEWRAHTSGPVTEHVVAGGHADFLRTAEVLPLILNVAPEGSRR